jgi:FkbM family methyltransferase
MPIIDRYRQLYTHDGKIFDLNSVDYTRPLYEIEQNYGWEAAMAFSNLYNDDLSCGRGVQQGDIVVDLGANIGMSSLNMERKNPRKIYCVEPDPKSYETLLMNKNDNWITDNVAIGLTEGYVDIGAWPWGQTVNKIRSITLDQYFTKHDFSMVNVMKVDIEGLEKQIFKTVSQSTLDKIESMAIEYHEDESLSVELKNKERIDFVHFFLDRGFLHFTVLSRKYQSMIYLWK